MFWVQNNQSRLEQIIFQEKILQDDKTVTLPNMYKCIEGGIYTAEEGFQDKLVVST